jgi:hypothetical protein
MEFTPTPTQAEFMAAPIQAVRAVAPATLIYGPGGTRRQAALAGIPFQSDAYAAWTHERMVESLAVLSHIGVRHIVINLLRPAQLAEVGRYRDRLLTWLEAGLAGADAIVKWRYRGWRVRIIGLEALPELHAAAERVAAATADQPGPTIWFYLCGAPHTPWASLFASTASGIPASQQAAIQALYGEDIPPATLYLAFGKPFVAYDIIPPLLAGELHCYWTQRPGFSLDEPTMRQILFDYAYLRSTWQQDKTARYAALDEQRAIWEQTAVLGLGQRLGPFWYPQGDLLARIGDDA